jgi:sugar lactone lactonase YvrE
MGCPAIERRLLAGLLVSGVSAGCGRLGYDPSGATGRCENPSVSGTGCDASVSLEPCGAAGCDAAGGTGGDATTGTGLPSLYWSDRQGGRILRTDIETRSTAVLVSQIDPAQEIAVDPVSGRLCWIDTNQVLCASRDGSGQYVAVASARSADGIAIDGAAAELYVTAEEPQWTIGRVPLGGGSVTVLRTGNNPEGIAVEPGSGKLYWTEWSAGTILRAGLDMSGQETLVTGLQQPDRLVVDAVAQRLYWFDREPTGQRLLRTAPLDGGVATTLVSGDGLEDVALDPERRILYWCDSLAGTITEALPDGTQAQTFLDGTGVPGSLVLGP